MTGCSGGAPPPGRSGNAGISGLCSEPSCEQSTQSPGCPRNPANVLKKAFIKKIMVFVTPKIRKLGVPARPSTHSGPGFGPRAQICSRTRGSNRRSATPRGHWHLSGNQKFDSSQQVMKVIKGASPRTWTPPFLTRLDELCMVLDGFWMVHAFWMDGPGITN